MQRLCSRHIRAMVRCRLPLAAGLIWVGTLQLWALGFGRGEEDRSAGKTAGRLQEAASVAEHWDRILGDVAVSTAGVRPKTPAEPPAGRGFGDFEDHFFYRVGVDFVHNFVTFTDNPTPTFVVDQGPPFSLTPEGFISFPSLFESNDSKLHVRATFGTRGYGHERLNTRISLLTYHDLDGTRQGSPFIGSLDAFDGRSRSEALNAYFELEGAGGGGWDNLDLRVGRQHSHDFFNFLRPLGATVMDGVNLKYRYKDVDFGGFVGYRPVLFASLDDRVVAGANFGARVSAQARVNYDFFFFADTGIHTFSFEPLFEAPLQLQGFFTLIGDDPVDLGVRAAYADGTWSIFGSFVEKLTDDDLIYDVFFRSEAETLLRLNLGPVSDSSRLLLDLTRQLGEHLALGGRVWIQELHDEGKQSGFDNSFQDFAVRVSVFPSSRWETSLEYGYHNQDRLDPGRADSFDDISRAGERGYDQFSGALGYRLPNRLNVEAGLYHRIFDLQNRITIIDDSKTTGFFANLLWRVTRQIDFRFSYGVDNDFFVFNPDIDLQHSLRLGMVIHN